MLSFIKKLLGLVPTQITPSSAPYKIEAPISEEIVAIKKSPRRASKPKADKPSTKTVKSKAKK